MLLAFLYILISVFFGFAVTLLLKEELLFEDRIFYGTLIGLVSSSWFGFSEALIFGLDLKTIVLTSSVLLLITLLIFYIKLYKRPIELSSTTGIFHSEVLFPIFTLSCIFFPVLHILFGRVILWKEDGLYTGLAYNLSDLPYHWSIINSFFYADNFPPDNTIFSGYPLRYYFLSDFFTALLMKSGLSLWGAFTLQGIMLSIVLVGILYLLTYRLTQNKIAAAITPFLFFFNGGLGFIQFFKDLISDRGNLINFFLYVKDYTNIGELGYRWINTTTSLLVPQRPFLFVFQKAIKRAFYYGRCYSRNASFFSCTQLHFFRDNKRSFIPSFSLPQVALVLYSSGGSISTPDFLPYAQWRICWAFLQYSSGMDG